MNYKVKVIETRGKVIDIESDSPKAAKERAENMWLNGAIDLNEPDDHDSHEIYLVGNE